MHSEKVEEQKRELCRAGDGENSAQKGERKGLSKVVMAANRQNQAVNRVRCAGVASTFAAHTEHTRPAMYNAVTARRRCSTSSEGEQKKK